MKTFWKVSNSFNGNNVWCVERSFFNSSRPKFKQETPAESIDLSLADVKRNEVKMLLHYSKSEKPIIVDEHMIKEVKLNKKVLTRVAIHGWRSPYPPSWYSKLINAYMKRVACNVLLIDWTIPAKKEYNVSSANCKIIGDYLANFLKEAELEPEKVHIIGYSLGAHAAGFAGKELFKLTNKKLRRITGLDPVAQNFKGATKENRLHKTDANFVDIVHTDDDGFGYTDPIGHVDFYPNGGKNQPGCDHEDICSHVRSIELFISSINSVTMIAYGAHSWKDFEQGNSVGSVVFGQNTSHTASGRYYFHTNATAPFARKPK